MKKSRIFEHKTANEIKHLEEWKLLVKNFDNNYI
jgi:hypothetical protein